MSTLVELRTQAHKDLGDPSGTRWTSADIDAYINEGYIEFCALTGLHRTTSDCTIVAGQSLYSTSDYGGWSGAKILRVVASNGAARLKLVDEDRMDFFKAGWRSTTGTQGTPTHAALSKTNPGYFYLWPTPNAAALTAFGGAVKVGFVSKPTTIADSSSPAIPDNFHPALAWYAVYRAYGRNNDNLSRSEATNALQEFQRYVQEGIEYAKRLMEDETITSPKIKE